MSDKSGQTTSFQEMLGFLSTGAQKKFSAGEVIFKEGAEDENFYLVLQGQIEVRKKTYEGNEKAIAQVGPGDFLGEGFLSGTRVKPASAYALSEVTLFTLSRDGFLQMLREKPEVGMEFLLRVMEGMVARLNRTNFKLLTVFEMNLFLNRRFSDMNAFYRDFLAQVMRITESDAGQLLVQEAFLRQPHSVCAVNMKAEDLKSVDLSRSHTVVNGKALMVIKMGQGSDLVLSRGEAYEEDQLKLMQLIGDLFQGRFEILREEQERKDRGKLQQKKINL